MQIWITQLEIVGYKILIKICFMGKIWKNVNLALPLFWGGNLILPNVSFAFYAISNCTTPCIKCNCPLLLFIQPAHYWQSLINAMGFLGGSDGKESACNVGDLGSISGLGRSPGEGNGNPFQYSCWENFLDRRGWWATVHAVAKSWTWLSN